VHYSTSNVYDILADQGATLNRALFLKTSAKRPVDISDYIGRMHIRDYTDSSIIIKTLTTENGGLTIDGLTGRVDILLRPSDTDNLEAKDYVYDLELESDEGDVTRVVSGKLTVRAEITY
jgi:hypothetical protein